VDRGAVPGKSASVPWGHWWSPAASGMLQVILPPTSPTIAPNPRLNAVEQVSANDSAGAPTGAANTIIRFSNRLRRVIKRTAPKTNLKRGVMSVTLRSRDRECPLGPACLLGDLPFAVDWSGLLVVIVQAVWLPCDAPVYWTQRRCVAPGELVPLSSQGCCLQLSQLRPTELPGCLFRDRAERLLYADWAC
jgi:hypothetical protein